MLRRTRDCGATAKFHLLASLLISVCYLQTRVGHHVVRAHLIAQMTDEMLIEKFRGNSQQGSYQERQLISPLNAMAVYDPNARAPRCFNVSASCDTGFEGLLDGVGEWKFGGTEPNAPNVVDDCLDVSDGVYSLDESINRIKVSSLDGENMTVGSRAKIEATVVTASNTTGRDNPDLMDVAHFFHVSNGNYYWKHIKTIMVQPGSGEVVLSCEYTIGPGDLQIVRVNYGYAEYTIGVCTANGGYADVDDLIFRVGPPTSSPTLMPSVNTVNLDSLAAVYDSQFGAPRCYKASASCDTGGVLIAGVGVDIKGGPEPNSPNTIDDCLDISDSVYEQDESINRIRVSSVDGGVMTVGSRAKIEATVFAANDPSGREDPYQKDVAHFFHGSNLDPSWKYIDSKMVLPGSGELVLSCEYTIAEGDIQVVRVHFGYEEYTIGNCMGNGLYSDVDDLVFAAVEKVHFCSINDYC